MMNMFLKTETKFKKANYSLINKKNLQSTRILTIQHKAPSNKLLFQTKSQLHRNAFHDDISFTPHLITPPFLKSSANDEYSIFSTSTVNTSVDLEQIVVDSQFQHDSQINELQSRKAHSITSSASTSKNSHNDESSLASHTSIIGRLYILNEIYPSIEYENMNGIPLVFLGAEKLLRTRIDWNKVHYPLSSYHIEIIIDLLMVRPSFIREIPKVTNFSLYRPLIKTVSGGLFFDNGENRAGIHQCGRKKINRKFAIDDLASIHQREFHIINYNATFEERFIKLYEDLSQIYYYQAKSTHWKTYLRKPKHFIDAFDEISTRKLHNI
ncbi:unnamed protein product [Rotaria socialis]|uniref:Uncharacterized protein n=2 Tax=Rotaria socialis TaxID=392032 RepID=A0A820W736_9BILA|nr:unnamed protein product [Rotaria socialis]CAF3375858.1 unnamed protein product [Rotaria socialis]CAF4218359.1 unnamed protein product [Rotaria socialis]CAF4375039.1 unnamed protein product [Rotaria socialis]CAF4512359.1 unnamed protein product [Rotaria socialis]